MIASNLSHGARLALCCTLVAAPAFAQDDGPEVEIEAIQLTYDADEGSVRLEPKLRVTADPEAEDLDQLREEMRVLKEELTMLRQTLKAEVGTELATLDEATLREEIEREIEEELARELGQLEQEIETLIASGQLGSRLADSDEIGQASRIDDAEGRYVVFLKKTFPVHLALDGLRVVLDCANGAAYKVGPTVLSELGAELFALGVEPRRDGRVRQPVFDLDCGSPADGAHEHCAGRTDRIRVLGTLGSRSSALVDLDGDGDLDVVTAEFNSAPQLLQSDLAARRPVSWLAVRLEGSTANRDGLGATVTLVAGPLTITQVHDGKTGYLAEERDVDGF